MKNQEYLSYAYHYGVDDKCPNCGQQLTEEGACLDCSEDADSEDI